LNVAKGRFISLEGGEGTGKSSQISRLAKHLEGKGLNVIITREPGGTPAAEDVRNLLVTGEPDRWDAMSELLLLYAARRAHVERVIKPALQRGDWVISDRFADSTMAYQGYAMGLGADVVKKAHELALGDFQPDLTLIMDLSVEIGLERAHARMLNHAEAENRYERMGAAFHNCLREAFLDIAENNPDRCVLVDASKSMDDVSDDIARAVDNHLGACS